MTDRKDPGAMPEVRMPGVKAHDIYPQEEDYIGWAIERLKTIATTAEPEHQVSACVAIVRSTRIMAFGE